jgi:hypothetical protein
MKLTKRIPQATVSPPQIRKSTLQDAKARFPLPIPYIMVPPMICEIPNIETHVLYAC